MALDLMKYAVAGLLFLLVCIWSSAAVAQTAVRPAHTSFKGLELYSWVDEKTNVWQFSVLFGTNRNKTEVEIRNNNGIVVGLTALKARLNETAVGEQIFWVSPNARFPYPPPEILGEIAGYAKEAEVELVVLH